MALKSLKHINTIVHPKYDIQRVPSMDGSFSFRVKLYLIYCEGRVFTLFKQTDWIDNVNLMRESGSSCSTFTKDIIVTPIHHPEIYNEIFPYV